MSAHIIAVDTYGAQRVTDPHTGKIISAQKLGYSSAVTPLLLALYGAKAHDVSPKKASYRYVQIDGEVVVRHGHILLSLRVDELEKAERITRQHHRAAVYLWRDQKWWAFPDSNHPDYTEPGYRTGPNFDPTNFRPPSPSTGEREPAINGILAEKSQRTASDKPWWWLSGDTYRHRDLLKRHGARFSGKRKAWYFIGEELPAAIQALVKSETQSDGEVRDGDAESPLLAIFGRRIVSKERVSNGDVIVKGESGIFATRTSWINQREQREPVWEFDLPPQERMGNPLPAIQKALQTNGAIYSLYTRKWHFDQPAKVAALDALVESVSFTDDELNTESKPEPEPISPPEEVQLPAIRILKPVPMPAEGEPLDAVQTAIRTVRTQSLAPIQREPVANGRVIRIEQAYVGELTGSITGNVWCYGYAVHEGICIYLNMGGPRMAVEAIRAKLSKGDLVTVVPWDAPSVELTAGEGGSGMYQDFFANIPEARFTSLILLHEMVIHPNYGGKSTTFLLYVSEAQVIGQLHRHVAQLVKVPVFEAWASYLWSAGQAAMLVRKTRGAGGLTVYGIDLDIDSWTRLITGGIEQGIIALP
ncbi:MAG: hypothetical protein J0M33_03095 [Anaerolineae bacterium]|nr:hypothetical protein [Anaerolineae bacterium]